MSSSPRFAFEPAAHELSSDPFFPEQAIRRFASLACAVWTESQDQLILRTGTAHPPHGD